MAQQKFKVVNAVVSTIILFCLFVSFRFVVGVNDVDRAYNQENEKYHKQLEIQEQQTREINQQIDTSIDSLQLADDNLFDCISSHMNHYRSPNTFHSTDTITGVDKIIKLTCTHKNIEYLDGIEALSGLEELDLEKNNISDISSLAELYHLKSLNLASNNIDSISPITGLTELRWLDISYNNIFDFRELSSLNLKTLYMPSLPNERCQDIVDFIDYLGFQKIYRKDRSCENY